MSNKEEVKSALAKIYDTHNENEDEITDQTQDAIASYLGIESRWTIRATIFLSPDYQTLRYIVLYPSSRPHITFYVGTGPSIQFQGNVRFRSWADLKGAFPFDLSADGKFIYVKIGNSPNTVTFNGVYTGVQTFFTGNGTWR